MYPAIYLARYLWRILGEEVSNVSFEKVASAHNFAHRIALDSMRECLDERHGEWTLPSEYKTVFKTVSQNRLSPASAQVVKMPVYALFRPRR